MLVSVEVLGFLLSEKWAVCIAEKFGMVGLDYRKIISIGEPHWTMTFHLWPTCA